MTVAALKRPDATDRAPGFAIRPFSVVDPKGERDAAAAVTPVQVRLDDLVGRAVRHGHDRIGEVVDVVITRSGRSVLGVDVDARGERFFLPWVTLRPTDAELRLATTPDLATRGALGLILSFGARLSKLGPASDGLVDAQGDIQAR